MRNFHNLPPRFAEVKDELLNIYQIRNEDNILTVRQPRRSDSGKYRLVWREISDETNRLYKRANVNWDTYEPKYRVNQPLYRGEIPGVMYLVMEVDGKIIGFADLIFDYGKRFIYHQIPENDVAASIALCISDKYHGLGYGTYFAEASQLIARQKGAVWTLGYTKMTDGMYNIRMKQGWEKVGINGNYAIIRASVIPSVVAEVKAEQQRVLETERQALLEAEKATSPEELIK